MRLRESVRGLILDPDDHVLLVRFDWEGLDIPGGFWANPGGGVEPGESRLAALQRELREEVGLDVDTLGPEVWTKTARFEMTAWDGQVDHIHLIRSERFEPRPALGVEELGDENVREIRWWAPGELGAPGVTFSPRALPELLAALRTDGAPSEPVAILGF